MREVGASEDGRDPVTGDAGREEGSSSERPRKPVQGILAWWRTVGITEGFGQENMMV